MSHYDTQVSEYGGSEHLKTETQHDSPLPPIQKITTSGANNEIIHIGETRVHREEFMAAFGGYFNPGLRHAPSRKMANVSALGLFAFSLTTLTLGLLLLETRGVAVPNVICGLALFYGGAVQVIAGIFEIFVENTFGMVTFCSYGCFWISYAAILMDGQFGIASAYNEADPSGQMFNHAVGIFLIGWLVFTTLLLMCTVRSTVAMFSVVLALELTILMLIAGYFSGSAKCHRAGGAFCVVTGILGFFNAFAGLATKENSYISVKPLYMPGAHRIRPGEVPNIEGHS